MQITREKFNAIVEDACDALTPANADKVRSSVSQIDRIAWGIYVTELDGVQCGCPLVVAGLLTSTGMASADLKDREASDFIGKFDDAVGEYVVNSDGTYSPVLKVVD